MPVLVTELPKVFAAVINVPLLFTVPLKVPSLSNVPVLVVAPLIVALFVNVPALFKAELIVALLVTLCPPATLVVPLPEMLLLNVPLLKFSVPLLIAAPVRLLAPTLTVPVLVKPFTAPLNVVVPLSMVFVPVYAKSLLMVFVPLILKLPLEPVILAPLAVTLVKPSMPPARFAAYVSPPLKVKPLKLTLSPLPILKPSNPEPIVNVDAPKPKPLTFSVPYVFPKLSVVV